MPLPFRLFVLLLLVPLAGRAQDAAIPWTRVDLRSLDAFAPTAGNWQIVGGAMADRHQERALDTTPGIGVLANLPTDELRDNLFSVWEHADIELDLEVLMPRGSNSGIYLQGRYEIQLLDSWGVDSLRFADLGSIYQRWDESRPEGERGFEGHAPPVNVSRAPGLWQHLNIVFRAPRFDAAGAKISDAMFVRVTLNGVLLHENVALTGPTRASAWEDEAARAPLMIQGDHGPVALRNIAYRTFDPGQVALTGLTEAYYTGDFNWQMPELAELTLVQEAGVATIDASRAPDDRRFALRYAGALEVPATGDYVFEVAHTARVSLEIDGAAVLSDRDENAADPGEFALRRATRRLTRGTHRLVLTYAKGNWHSVPTALGLSVAGPRMLRTTLTAPASLPRDAFVAYDLEPTDTPILQRTFFYHRGEPRTHAMAVGEPQGTHYAYDMGSGALLSVWKGRFANASTMWYERGGLQSALPEGSVIELAGWPTVAVLTDDSAPWPVENPDYAFKGYRLQGDGEHLRPLFTARVGDIDVVDTYQPSADGPFMRRVVNLTGQPAGGKAWVFVAEGKTIELLDSGAYAVDDQTYYIENLQGGQAFVRNVGGKSELLVGVDLASGGGEVTYDLVW